MIGWRSVQHAVHGDPPQEEMDVVVIGHSYTAVQLDAVLHELR
jgi:hypothetical protein